MPSPRGTTDVKGAVSPRFQSQMVGLGAAGLTHHHAVIPGEDGELTEASNEVPSSGDVTSYEDAERENGEWVHRSRAVSLRVEHAERRERRSRQRE